MDEKDTAKKTDETVNVRIEPDQSEQIRAIASARIAYYDGFADGMKEVIMMIAVTLLAVMIAKRLLSNVTE